MDGPQHRRQHQPLTCAGARARAGVGNCARPPGRSRRRRGIRRAAGVRLAAGGCHAASAGAGEGTCASEVSHPGERGRSGHRADAGRGGRAVRPGGMPPAGAEAGGDGRNSACSAAPIPAVANCVVTGSSGHPESKSDSDSSRRRRCRRTSANTVIGSSRTSSTASEMTPSRRSLGARPAWSGGRPGSPEPPARRRQRRPAGRVARPSRSRPAAPSRRPRFRSPTRSAGLLAAGTGCRW